MLTLQCKCAQKLFAGCVVLWAGLSVVSEDSLVRDKAWGGKLIRELVQFEQIPPSTYHPPGESSPLFISSPRCRFFSSHLLSPARISPPLINPGLKNKCQIRIFWLFDAPIDTRGRGQIGIPFKGYHMSGLEWQLVACNLEQFRLLSLEQSVPGLRQTR